MNFEKELKNEHLDLEIEDILWDQFQQVNLKKKDFSLIFYQKISELNCPDISEENKSIGKIFEHMNSIQSLLHQIMFAPNPIDPMEVIKEGWLPIAKEVSFLLKKHFFLFSIFLIFFSSIQKQKEKN